MNKKNLFLISFSLILLISLSSFAKKKAKGNGAEPVDLTDIRIAVDNHGKSLATITNQVNEVVSKFQEVSGETGRNFKKNRDQDKLIKDFETRLQVLEDKNSMLTGQIQELVTEGLVSKDSTQRFDEYKDYARALEYINAMNYDKAVKELKRFKSENKKSIFNSYAQYWIGEAFYMQSDFPMAIKQYQKLLSKHPKSAKAPTALYRQGLAFYQLNSFDEAKAFFAKVVRSYPRSIEAVQASSQITRINSIQKLKKQQEWEMKMVQ